MKMKEFVTREGTRPWRGPPTPLDPPLVLLIPVHNGLLMSFPPIVLLIAFKINVNNERYYP